MFFTVVCGFMYSLCTSPQSATVFKWLVLHGKSTKNDQFLVLKNAFWKKYKRYLLTCRTKLTLLSQGACGDACSKTVLSETLANRLLFLTWNCNLALWEPTSWRKHVEKISNHWIKIRTGVWNNGQTYIITITYNILWPFLCCSCFCRQVEKKGSNCLHLTEKKEVFTATFLSIKWKSLFLWRQIYMACTCEEQNID